MALYIINENQGASIEWHIGEKLPTKYSNGITHFVISEISEIQADGDELDKIRTLFNASSVGANYTIPMARTSVMNWFGDTAKTILSALI